jgi:anionic glutamate receptor
LCTQEYSAQITFRETWIDDRLAFEQVLQFPSNTTLPKFVVLPQTSSGKKQEIWMPDTFFVNEKQARKHDIDKPNVLIRIHKDGSILYSVR